MFLGIRRILTQIEVGIDGAPAPAELTSLVLEAPAVMRQLTDESVTSTLEASQLLTQM